MNDYNQYNQQEGYDQYNQPNEFDQQYASAPQPAPKTGLALLFAKLGMGSFMVSMLVHAVFVILAIFFIFKWIKPPAEPIPDFIPGGGGGGGQNGEVAHKIKTSMRRTVSATLSSKRITANTNTSSFTLPETTDMPAVPLPSDAQASSGDGGGVGGGHGKGIGRGIGSGEGLGRGFGKGTGMFSLIPTIMQGRCTPAERKRMVREAGGNDALEVGVKKSLDWLKSQQKPDGSWGDSYNVAMTGFALLCYLGHCEDTQSADYGAEVSKAIGFLVNIGMANDGKLGSGFAANGWVYEHGIATYALAEALTFSKNLKFPIENLEYVVSRAAQNITEGQNTNGSWDYKFNSSSTRNDLSVAGWQMQALKAVKASGATAPGLEGAMRKAVSYLGDEAPQGAYLGDGKFAYSGGSHSPALTGVGALCLQQWGKGNSKEAKAGVKYIFNGLKERTGDAKGAEIAGQEIYAFKYKTDCDLYAFYYASQAMRNAGGAEWAAMNKAILEEILPNQNVDGSFQPPGKLRHAGGGPVYAHCLNTLIMEVYYRFLPATSSGNSGAARGLDGLR